MSKNFDLKKEQVAQIVEWMNQAQSMVLIDYRGLKVSEDTDLRRQFRKSGVKYVVLKNKLLRLAAAECGIEGLDSILEGPTAVAFGMDDLVAPAKIALEFAKKNPKLEIKAGVLDKNVLDVAGVKALADLPPREVLLAKMLGSLNAPITGLVTVLGGTLRSLLYTLVAVKEKKESAA